MTPQEIFDKVVIHLFSMPNRSLAKGSSERCAYRSHDGLKCAVGALIPDDMYRPWMDHIGASPAEGGLGEGTGIIRMVRYYPGYFPEDVVTNRNLLNELQSVHDHGGNWDPDKIGQPFASPINTLKTRKSLEIVARIHNLNTDVLNLYPTPVK